MAAIARKRARGSSRATKAKGKRRSRLALTVAWIVFVGLLLLALYRFSEGH